MGKKILIVEDEFQIAESIKNYLKKYGYDYEHAVTYTDAIAYLKNGRFGAVLIDIKLGDNENEDGVALAIEIDKEFRLPYLFVTGQYNAAILKTIAELECKNFVCKPVREENLISNLKIVIESYCKFIQISKNCVYDKSEMKVYKNKKLAKLSKNEIKLLDRLAVNINSFVKRDDLISYIWEDNPPKAKSSLRELKRNLLKKLDKSIKIENRPFYGYRLVF